MYVPPHFKSDDDALTRKLIAENTFGILSVPAAPDAISHLPMLLVDDGEAGEKLIGHVAKANPVWKTFDGTHPAVAIFSGPHAYLSPNWYVSENMVPTWNYAAVHVFGHPIAVTDDDAADAVLQTLVAAFESDATGNWSMDGLDTDFRRRQLKGIVAFEMPVERIETKLKMSQNRSAEDVDGAMRGLETTGDADALATVEIMRSVKAGRR
jgi:transcriptional regulator